jgi:choline/ethanolamine phosphotransferase
MHFVVLQVAHMSRSPLNGWDTAYVGPLVVCVNQYFNLLIGEHFILWIFLVSSDRDDRYVVHIRHPHLAL